MPIEMEILSMFELGRKLSQVILVVFLDRKWQKSQRISVPTDQQTLLMHQYLQSQGFCCSVGTALYACVRGDVKIQLPRPSVCCSQSPPAATGAWKNNI